MRTQTNERIKQLLTDTIILLCKNGVPYNSEFSVNALIGITVDKTDILLVSINETLLASETGSRQSRSQEPVLCHSRRPETIIRQTHTPTSETILVSQSELNHTDNKSSQPVIDVDSVQRLNRDTVVSVKSKSVLVPDSTHWSSLTKETVTDRGDKFRSPVEQELDRFHNVKNEHDQMDVDSVSHRIVSIEHVSELNTCYDSTQREDRIDERNRKQGHFSIPETEGHHVTINKTVGDKNQTGLRLSGEGCSKTLSSDGDNAECVIHAVDDSDYEYTDDDDDDDSCVIVGKEALVGREAFISQIGGQNNHLLLNNGGTPRHAEINNRRRSGETSRFYALPAMHVYPAILPADVSSSTPYVFEVR